MTDLPGLTWLRFGIWLAVGVLIYALYGYRHSRVRTEPAAGTPGWAREPEPEPGDEPGAQS
jgi:APA family basic amino acid/polyamine antiporter